MFNLFDLEKEYTQKYKGKFFLIDGRWVELIKVQVYFSDEVAHRNIDHMIDALGNQWWIKNELEAAMAAGKILTRDELPNNAKIVERS